MEDCLACSGSDVDPNVDAIWFAFCLKLLDHLARQSEAGVVRVVRQLSDIGDVLPWNDQHVACTYWVCVQYGYCVAVFGLDRTI